MTYHQLQAEGSMVPVSANGQYLMLNTYRKAVFFKFFNGLQQNHFFSWLVIIVFIWNYEKFKIFFF